MSDEESKPLVVEIFIDGKLVKKDLIDVFTLEKFRRFQGGVPYTTEKRNFTISTVIDWYDREEGEFIGYNPIPKEQGE